ncbi:DUF1992 domain-containing protein [Phytohabitans sp. ZYX-F-186]|uniref:DUF1992 domain-containing protein n=1 Tax=Phytohabitans maris TaxID=3071409 RepID=A0ABU0ZS47_9ACTN|nr:DUF1992 domain-containing protein [Phytohabitans sp. ZYX-F-186]MDQ7909853.1 DUF1992 domain-containing protein [Phytohabitans sp. ZYX-F-186]
MSYSHRFESLIEARIREARENGEFDDLPGAGKPIPGKGEPYDENWWIKQMMRREDLGDVALPASLRLARDLDRLPEQVRQLRSEQRVRETVADLNARVAAYRDRPTEPYVKVRPLDADEVVRAWRRRP